MDRHIPTKYAARTFLRPKRSASGGTAKQPRMVPIERIAVATEAVFAAEVADMPAFLARVITAVGSYTDPAHKPTIATASSAALTIVRWRYFALKISASGLRLCRLSVFLFHRSGSFARVEIRNATTTGDRPQRNIARQPK